MVKLRDSVKMKDTGALGTICGSACEIRSNGEVVPMFLVRLDDGGYLRPDNPFNDPFPPPGPQHKQAYISVVCVHPDNLEEGY